MLLICPVSAISMVCLRVHLVYLCVFLHVDREAQVIAYCVTCSLQVKLISHEKNQQ